MLDLELYCRPVPRLSSLVTMNIAAVLPLARSRMKGSGAIGDSCRCWQVSEIGRDESLGPCLAWNPVFGDSYMR